MRQRTAEGQRGGLRDTILALRPWQWIKNLVVLLPVVFARRFDDSIVLREGLLATMAFCLLASGVYLFNDVCDKRADFEHPTRKNRPIAAGRIAPRMAIALSAILVALGFLALLLPRTNGPRTLAPLLIAGSYVALNVAYSLALKRAMLAGALCVAIGFVIRVALGGAVTEIEVSHWLFICIFLGALTVALGKRWSDSVAKTDETMALATRIVGASFVISYVAYGVAPRTLEVFGTRALVFSAPFVALGVYAFQRQAARGRAADPARLFLRDPLLFLSVLLYATSIGAIFATH